ncbi:hypothetical protein DRO69_09240 [Candidatus Bathyarchaeota archaeon]|nr:MAG: hypothetical protein DRO69_09240 [Candidatus Bathyarchaeota archaeon]
MAEVKLPGATGLRDIIEKYKVKIESGILPPDPARIVELILRVPVEVEHLLPIPPVVEYVHSNFTRPLVESLPRLPMTSEPHEFEWLKWIKEEFKI